jgi:hypothetical protein
VMGETERHCEMVKWEDSEISLCRVFCTEI